MKKKLVGIFVLMLLIATSLPLIGATNKNNELEDIHLNEKQDLEFKSEPVDSRTEISFAPRAPPLIDEGFEGGVMPPAGWTLENFSDTTWMIDPYYSCTGLYSATCLFDTDLQNEWLISPLLNFAGYHVIYLSFWWSMDYYWAVTENNYDLNVSISIDGGENWTLLWNEHEAGSYDSTHWYNTTGPTGDKRLDLSKYIGNTSVKIGFQYNGSNGADASIDDIFCWGIPISVVECDAGGPYDGWCSERIYFKGTAQGGKKPYSWRWEFGDGDNSTEQNPKHKYTNPGNYTVTLTVTDADNNQGWNKTDANITKPPHARPQITIINIPKNSIGVRAEVKNIGNYGATNVEWKITVTGGLFKIVERNGSIPNIAMGQSTPIRSKYYLGIGFGSIDIKMQADPEFGIGCVRDYSAFKIGPFILNIKIS
jgi:hypothetical protein